MALDDAGDDVGEIGVGLDADQLAGLDERGDHGPVLGTTVGAGEQCILASEGKGPDAALDNVVVDLNAAVVEEQAQSLPARQRVADRFSDRIRALSSAVQRRRPTAPVMTSMRRTGCRRGVGRN